MEQIDITGGLPDGEPASATILSRDAPRQVGRDPGETLESFCERVKTMAAALHASCVVFGGLDEM